MLYYYLFQVLDDVKVKILLEYKTEHDTTTWNLLFSVMFPSFWTS